MTFLDSLQSPSTPDTAILVTNLANRNPEPIRFTIASASTPSYLTKRFFLDENGQIQKESHAYLRHGEIEIRSCYSLTEFAEIRQGLQPHQALIYGLPTSDKRRIVTQADLDHSPDAIARKREYFAFPDGLGVMMFDYDPVPDQLPLTPEALYQDLLYTVPELADAPVLWCPSASSGVGLQDQFESPPITGQRLYCLVKNARLIPQAGEAFATLSWANGRGRIQLSSSGRMLKRIVFDTSVWGAERLDFAAKPILESGLVRLVPDPMILGHSDEPFDLQRLIDLVDAQVQARADLALEMAKQQARPVAEQKFSVWIDRRQHDIETPVQPETARKAIQNSILTHDFPLISEDGRTVTVLDLLKDPKSWHEKRFHDPLEPEYRNDSRIAYANLKAIDPYLYSHAHGGQCYHLEGERQVICVRSGYRSQAVDAYIQGMQELNEFFELGRSKKLVRVREHQAMVLELEHVTDILDRRFEYHRLKEVNGNWIERLEDTPITLVKAIVSRAVNAASFPSLDAVITAPTLRLDGSILDQSGYDPISKLYLSLDADYPEIPVNPSLQACQEALNVFWEPVAQFPLVSPVDRGVVLSGMFSSLVRPSLPTTPGHAFDAPVAGSGKTLLAQILAMLASGKEASVLPPISGNEEEVRKRLLSALIGGERVLLWDNLDTPLGSAALDAALTSGAYQDRELNHTNLIQVPNRSLFLFTGNNLRIIGDTCRRVLVARLDPKMERPDCRQFDFNPVQLIQAQRPRFVVAGLTLMRGWLSQDCPPHGQGSTASFDDWNRIVRQTICWVSTWDDRFADPNAVIQKAFDEDPNTLLLRSLLESWWTAVGSQPMTTKEIVELAQHTVVDADGCQIQRHPELLAAIEAIAGDRQGIINSRFGNWVSKHKERWLGGRCFVKSGTSHSAAKWKVDCEMTVG